MSSSNSEHTPVIGLLLITAAAVCVQGYHLGADDAAIYVPGIKKAADPGLYPFGAEFFQSHANLSLFPNLVGGSARLTGLPADLVIFAWHLAGVFLLMMAAWRLVSACFENEPARWGGVALLATVLSVPVAGTALAIADPYVTARTLSTPATVFAVACFVSGRRRQAAAWWLFTALIHPQMSVYATAFLGCLSLPHAQACARDARSPVSELAYFSALPFVFAFEPTHGAAREALLSRTYFFVSRWAWYEWIGVVAPLALLWWFSTVDLRGTRPAFRAMTRALVPFGLLFTGAAVLLTIPALQNYTRLQPMRSLHVLYVIFFLLLGGLIGEYAQGRQLWRWVALFAPLAVSLWLVQRSAYPASTHLEWPGAEPANAWTAAFLWVRQNTPKDAVFALDPQYLLRPGEDMHGFRAVAERSMLADAVKDSGVVSLFPQLAGEWERQVQALAGWEHFQLADFERIGREFPVTWVVTRRPAADGLSCPYEKQFLAVCRIPAANGMKGERP
jgi:hypothetical protein